METQCEEKFKETKKYYVLKIPKSRFDSGRTRKNIPDYWLVKKDKVATIEHKLARASEMIDLRENKKLTYEQIGNQFELTRGRVYQIIQWGKEVLKDRDSKKPSSKIA